MRFESVRRRTFALLALASGALGMVQAQQPAAPESPPRLDEAKLIAQQAALPRLRGEEPFILRESSWSGEIAPGKARLIQVQLFKRNGYHFWFAVPDRRGAVNLNLYNGEGELVPSTEHRYDESNVIGLEVLPEDTGIYFLRISLQNTLENPQNWSVIYAYR